jgi:hypothetical protein
MRLCLAAAISIVTACALIAAIPAAHADHAPAIVVPGKRGIPVIINGHDASGAVVIGDWGLYRPGHMAPVVIYRQPLAMPRHYYPSYAVRRTYVVRKAVSRRRHARVSVVPRKVVARPGFVHFFPGGTSPPKLGRVEGDGPFEKPPPAESFSRSWSTHSAPTPATLPQAPVVVAPIVTAPFRPKPKP